MSEENKVATDKELRARAENIAITDYVGWRDCAEAIYHELAALRDQLAQEIADRDGIIIGLLGMVNGDKGTPFKSIKKRLEAQRKGK